MAFSVSKDSSMKRPKREQKIEFDNVTEQNPSHLVKSDNFYKKLSISTVFFVNLPPPLKKILDPTL